MRRLPPIVMAFFTILILVLIWNVWVAVRQRLLDRQTITDTPNRTDLLRTDEDQRLVLDELTIEPAILADGLTTVALSGSGDTFTRFDLAGGTTTTLTTEAVVRGIDFVRYAPDGSSAIVHRNADLHGPGSTILYRFPNGGTANLSPQITDLAYLPDGQTIIYLYKAGDDAYSLARARPDGSEWRTIMDNLRLAAPSLHLAPDGKRILIAPDPTLEVDESVSARTDPTPLVVFLEAETSEPMPQLTGGRNFRWSPDSLRLAYDRPTDNAVVGAFAIYDMDTGTEVVTTVTTGGRLFAWQDSTRLIAAPLITDGEVMRIGDHPIRVATDGTTTELPGVSLGSGLHELHVAPQANLVLLLIRGALISVPLP